MIEIVVVRREFLARLLFRPASTKKREISGSELLQALQ